MQWLMAGLVAVVMVGGLAGYVSLRGQPEQQARRELVTAISDVVLEVESTTDLGGQGDPFALDAGSSEPALRVSVGADERDRRTVAIETLSAGTVQRLPVEGLVEGRNQLLVEASPVAAPAALRLAIVVDGQPLRTRLVWLEPGVPGVATIDLDLGATRRHGHDHD